MLLETFVPHAFSLFWAEEEPLPLGELELKPQADVLAELAQAAGVELLVEGREGHLLEQGLCMLLLVGLEVTLIPHGRLAGSWFFLDFYAGISLVMQIVRLIESLT